MPLNPLAGIADNVLASFVARTVQAGMTREAFTSLFLPETFRDQTTQLSSTELVSLLLGSRRALVGLSTAAERLDIASPLALFHGAGVSSSNSAAVSAEITAGISSSSRPETATYSFTVAQVALAQANVGSALSSNAVTAFTAGTNTARFVQNGVTIDVGFTVTGGQSNDTVLTNFAAAINNATGLNVGASVRTDSVAGTSRLVLTSRSTGTTNAFSVSNVAGSPVTEAGVGSATTSAQNASYTLNGTAFTSDSNDFYIGTYANLHINFISTSSSAVVVSVKPDVSRLTDAISGLADAYNAAKSLFDTYRDFNPAVSSHLGSVVERLRGDLAGIGITVGASGSLDINSDDLSAALTSHYSTVVRVVGETRGLAPELRSIADTMLARPSAEIAPLPPFQAGYAPQILAGTYAVRLSGLRLTGLLVDALS